MSLFDVTIFSLLCIQPLLSRGHFFVIQKKVKQKYTVVSIYAGLHLQKIFCFYFHTFRSKFFCEKISNSSSLFETTFSIYQITKRVITDKLPDITLLTDKFPDMTLLTGNLPVMTLLTGNFPVMMALVTGNFLVTI